MCFGTTGADAAALQSLSSKVKLGISSLLRKSNQTSNMLWQSYQHSAIVWVSFLYSYCHFIYINAECSLGQGSGFYCACTMICFCYETNPGYEPG